MKKYFLLFLLLNFFSKILVAQNCTDLGQNPSTAFPVCGTSTFKQDSVSLCNNGSLYVPNCNNGSDYEAKNPYWYKFTCFESGTLEFLITPFDLGDDYDWQLYDITDHQPEDVYTDRSLVVTGNWAGTYGETGTRKGGANYIQCSSIPNENKPSFAAMPNLIKGHKYLLLVSHFTESQSGYDLSFGNGGTAVITDFRYPSIKDVLADCSGQTIEIIFNKELACKSLATNGSDFTIDALGINIVSAVSDVCKNSFDMTYAKLKLSAPLPPGTYNITVKQGIDGNTLLDNCDREIASGSSIKIIILPLIPTPMDSITDVKCAPRTLELVFRKNMLCNTIEPSGSDFYVTLGGASVNITSARSVSCIDGLSKKIEVTLSQPLQVGGTYNILLKKGTDGNTIFDECSQETPAGSNLDFEVSDTVNADFTYTIDYSCTEDIVSFAHPGGNMINSWNWNFDYGQDIRTEQNPVKTYTDFAPKQVSLTVSNARCSDVSRKTIDFENYMIADFEVSNVICPDSPAIFKNNTIGNIVNWNWTFDNGNTSSVQHPPNQYYESLFKDDYYAKPELIIENTFGCYDTVQKTIRVVFSCVVSVPTAFTPNGDGVNDYLYPLAAYNTNSLKFSVYNRFGQKVFYTENFNSKWNGIYKGAKQEMGTYVWELNYIDNQTGKRMFQKGTTVLIR